MQFFYTDLAAATLAYFSKKDKLRQAMSAAAYTYPATYWLITETLPVPDCPTLAMFPAPPIWFTVDRKSVV